MIRLICFSMPFLLARVLFSETISSEESSELRLVPYNFEMPEKKNDSYEKDKKTKTVTEDSDQDESSSKSKDRNTIVETETMTFGNATIEYTYEETKPDILAEFEAEWKRGSKKEDAKKDTDEKNKGKKTKQGITIKWGSD